MPAFWRQAAQLVEPGGSVAIFAKCSFFCHPSTPNIAAVQRVFDTFSRASLAPHPLPNNRLCRDFYRDLALPWQSDNPSPEFPEALFERHTWNVDGALDGPDGDDFFGGSVMLTPAKIAELLGSTGPVQRWREAHPREAGTERDAVAVMVRELEAVVGVGGEVRMGMGYALLVFKRR
ncbi:hypothetical protein SLS58_006515 [Diplodia intermedia]|uniref:Methyltransferase n=1 Tax=Diplodia intermedia TaxID=856260 RepID=A0ABR3TMS3_9PEZI